ncbi:hypothetical protein [Paenibacillus polymyxa]|uniref:hypothetical protein n=1 Tax=Paenibacillus polymyxa TaxID=1406 RepID=UPI0025B70B02|nr:hypothetical protein [Paenibacillus polymyxa]MDN4090937.1 hypothetical protein [Paenibacillus polymyxa]
MFKWLERRKEKKRMEDRLDQFTRESDEAFIIWDNMLYRKKIITVLEALSSEELTEKYNEFLQMNDNGDGRLGSIWSIDDKNFSLSNGTYILQIEHTSFALKDRYTPEQYCSAIASYEDLSDKENTLREDLIHKYG